MITEQLKKQTRSFDLAVTAGRKRQSARTKFVHDEETIPVYENFCFALALFRQKTTDSVTEAKELIQRLLAFQTPDGNFPVFLHDYPRCFDFQMGLKVAPILIHILRLFTPVLGELKIKIEEALKKALEKRTEKPLWENRYRACVGEPLLAVDTSNFSASDWTDWLITAQLAGQTHFAIPYDENLQLFMGPAHLAVQEKGEPQPNAIEWLLAEGTYSARLLRDHPHQLLLAPLFPITYESKPVEEPSFRLYWKGTMLHSIVAKSLTFDLPAEVELGRVDFFEAMLFCNISSETEIFVGDRKATSFRLGDEITIRTPNLTVELKFELTLGSGDFCGQIFRANRSSQIACKGANQYEAYDWQIGLRTLRRQGPAQIQISLKY